LDALLEPVLHLLLNPSDPATRSGAQTHAFREPSGVFKALNVLRAVEDELSKLLLAD
jgi:hypothetical protein